jgi:hypothetical protein
MKKQNCCKKNPFWEKTAITGGVDTSLDIQTNRELQKTNQIRVARNQVRATARR